MNVEFVIRAVSYLLILKINIAKSLSINSISDQIVTRQIE